MTASRQPLSDRTIAFWLPLEMYQMETEPQETFVDLGKGWFQYQDIRHAIEIIT